MAEENNGGIISSLNRLWNGNGNGQQSTSMEIFSLVRQYVVFLSLYTDNCVLVILDKEAENSWILSLFISWCLLFYFSKFNHCFVVYELKFELFPSI